MASLAGLFGRCMAGPNRDKQGGRSKRGLAGVGVVTAMPRILFVSGFHPATRARDLAFEFERYVLSPPLSSSLFRSHTASCLSFGPLIRCDVPAPRNPSAHSNPYVLFFLCFFLLFRCSATSAVLAARSPVVSARTRMHAYFHFDSSAVVFPRHSISRRVRTKAQLPSTVAVTHSLSFAAPVMLRMPIMTCMSLPPPYPVFPHSPFLFFSGTDACLRVHA